MLCSENKSHIDTRMIHVYDQNTLILLNISTVCTCHFKPRGDILSVFIAYITGENHTVTLLEKREKSRYQMRGWP